MKINEELSDTDQHTGLEVELVEFGSFYFQVDSPDSDIDLVCLFPSIF
jgi:DNA polymerase sigma